MKRISIFFVILMTAWFALNIFGDIDYLEEMPKSVKRNISLPLITVSLFGMIYFIVDAFRRQYEGDNTLPVALALMGPFSVGLTTIVYYFGWGWMDGRMEYASEFCDTCTSQTTEFDQPLDLSVINFVNGGRLIGSAKRCTNCGSTIKTHCFYLFGMPLYSRGSFRAQCPERGRYLLRKRNFYWPHLLHLAVIPVVIIAIGLTLWLLDR